MAGTSYFNSGSRSNNSDSPFYKLKPLPLTDRTNVRKNSSLNTLSSANIPVWRAAAANNYFSFASSYSTLTLSSVSSVGVVSTVGTSIFNSYLANSNCVAAHLNTADQCMYVLLHENPQYRLIKVSDVAGTTTTIGSAFTPATAANWPTDFNLDNASLEVVSGELVVYFRGYKHNLNKSTGAIVAQDQVVTLGSKSLVNTNYLSVAGDITAGMTYGTSTSTFTIFSLVTSTLVSTDFTLPINYVLEGVAAPTTFRVLVDNDKLFLGLISGEADSNVFGYVSRSNYDQFLNSVATWHLGG